VGIQGGRWARGFLFDDDFSGMQINYKGEMFEIPFIWVKAYEGTSYAGNAKDANDLDGDYYVLAPKFSVAGMVDINPYIMYLYSKDGSAWLGDADIDDVNSWYLGIDVDANLEIVSLWATGIYQGGSYDLKSGGESGDFKGWLAALGGAFNINIFDIHAQGFYASGDDVDEPGDDIKTFTPPQGRSYYWSEIMGLGIFDFQTSNNSPGDGISNIWAANLGTTLKPMDKLKVAFDVWYAELVEDVMTLNGDEESSLGTELDLVLTYEVVQNLNLDLVGAYLFAGDATTMNADNDANPWELGARLSLSF